VEHDRVVTSQGILHPSAAPLDRLAISGCIHTHRQPRRICRNLTVLLTAGHQPRITLDKEIDLARTTGCVCSRVRSVGAIHNQSTPLVRRRVSLDDGYRQRHPRHLPFTGRLQVWVFASKQARYAQPSHDLVGHDLLCALLAVHICTSTPLSPLHHTHGSLSNQVDSTRRDAQCR